MLCATAIVLGPVLVARVVKRVSGATSLMLVYWLLCSGLQARICTRVQTSLFCRDLQRSRFFYVCRMHETSTMLPKERHFGGVGRPSAQHGGTHSGAGFSRPVPPAQKRCVICRKFGSAHHELMETRIWPNALISRTGGARKQQVGHPQSQSARRIVLRRGARGWGHRAPTQYTWRRTCGVRGRCP